MRVAIAGYGVEGRANYDYWRDKAEVVIVDERPSIDDLPEGVETILGEGAFSKLDGFDIVVRTAGLSPRKITTRGKIWSATNEFFDKCPAPIIGVTGTKGKGTTSSLIASIFRANKSRVHLIGNIGTPALEVLDSVSPDDVVVYELSSFQLWDLEKSPHVAVVLAIEPDHLDVHEDFQDYVTAKTNIALFQQPDDVVVYHRGNKWSRMIAEASKAGIRIEYPFDIGVLADSLRIPGRHNLDNTSAAVAVARQLGVADEAISEGLKDFTGLPHRLKFVAEKKGVKYYDDSISTTAGSAVAAINSFDEPKILILGGSSKGTAYDDIIEACRHHDVKIIAVGQTGDEIEEACHRFGLVVERVHGLMDEVVRKADEMAHVGDVVILSPASASFDQYANYADRGDKFIAAVNDLADW